MSTNSIIEKIKADITAALSALKDESALALIEPPRIIVQHARDKTHGDLACNVAMQLAKPEKKSPIAIAEMIRQKLLENVPVGKIYSRIDVAKPGFLNFFISETTVLETLEEILVKGADYGRSQIGKGKSVNIEFVSANPTGPLTVGHGRQAVIGDTLANVFHLAGFQVTREYYFNDAGNQMRLLTESVKARYRELLGEKAEFPEDGYQGDYIKDIAKELLENYGKNLPDDSTFKDRAEQGIFDDIKDVLGRIGVVFDEFFNEHLLYQSGKIDEVIGQLKSRGLAYEKEGALWLSAEKLGIAEDRVIVKSTGEPTYRLPDICYHMNKLNRSYDAVIDIFGADHIATVPDVLAAVAALGYDTSPVRVLIHQFVTLTRESKQVKMSTRKATYITLDEIVDELGKDAVRYFYNMRRAESHLDFDLEIAKKQSMENPVYYIQYAHARISSIFKKYREKTGVDAEREIEPNKERLKLLSGEDDLALIKQLGKFPHLIESIIETLEGHRLNDYLYEVASTLQVYYTRHRVIGDNDELTRARLLLMKAVRSVIANGLSLLGITAPYSM